jgi:hypothetical protein
MDRKSLAPYYGERPDMPLPSDWTTRKFDDPKVVKSFTNFTMRAIATSKPNYLAIGVESTVLLSTDAAAWPAYKRLHRAAYVAVKKRYPKLSVFFSTEVNHYLGRSEGSSSKQQEHASHHEKAPNGGRLGR